MWQDCHRYWRSPRCIHNQCHSFRQSMYWVQKYLGTAQRYSDRCKQNDYPNCTYCILYNLPKMPRSCKWACSLCSSNRWGRCRGFRWVRWRRSRTETPFPIYRTRHQRCRYCRLLGSPGYKIPKRSVGAASLNETVKVEALQANLSSGTYLIPVQLANLRLQICFNCGACILFT